MTRTTNDDLINDLFNSKVKREIELSVSEQITKQRKAEKICDSCGLTMKEKKRKRKMNKERTVYFCSCGNRFRKRTTNEILRDIGFKD